MLVGYIDWGKIKYINKKQQNPSIGRGRVSYTDASAEEKKTLIVLQLQPVRLHRMDQVHQSPPIQCVPPILSPCITNS